MVAQYVHYSDPRDIHSSTQRATADPKTVPDTITKIIRDTVRLVIRDTVRLRVKDTIRVTVKDTVKKVVHDTLRLSVRDTIEIVVHDTVNVCPTETVYHKWPDRCPAVAGAIPVLRNYVPPQLVLKLTEIFKGYLYSISATKNANNKPEYELKVCENGFIKIEYADENGNIIAKRQPGKKKVRNLSTKHQTEQ